MSKFESCRYYERTLAKKYTMCVERENIRLNKKIINLLSQNQELVSDLAQTHQTIEELEYKIQCLEAVCDPDNDPYEMVEDVNMSPIVLTNTAHNTKIVIHRGKVEEENEGEEDEDEKLEPAENEVNDEPALDMSASDYEKEEEEEEEVCATGDVEVKSGGVLEVSTNSQDDWGDWTYGMSFTDISRY